MTPQDIVDSLPGYFADIEAHRGTKLTPEQLGILLTEIGQAIKDGQYSESADASKFYSGCTQIRIVSRPGTTAHPAPMLCLCPSC